MMAGLGIGGPGDGPVDVIAIRPGPICLWSENTSVTIAGHSLSTIPNADWCRIINAACYQSHGRGPKENFQGVCRPLKKRSWKFFFQGRAPLT